MRNNAGCIRLAAGYTSCYERTYLIAEGDDWPTEYHRGFDVPARAIEDILLDSESWDLPIKWNLVVKGNPNLKRLLKTLNEIQTLTEFQQVFYQIDGCHVDNHHWGGDMPGCSGVWVKIYAESGKLAMARQIVCELADALAKYWRVSGNEARAKQEMAELKARQEAEAKELDERRRQESLACEQERRRGLEAQASEVVTTLLEYLNAPNGPYREIGRFLATEKGVVYVLTLNGMNYFSYHGSFEKLAVNKLRKCGYKVVEVLENYPPQTGRIPYFAGPMRASVMGWGTRATLLELALETENLDQPEVVRSSYLEWKNRASPE